MNFLNKVKPVLKKTKTFLGKVNDAIRSLWIIILSLFEKHQELRVRYNQYNVEGEIIDNLTRVLPMDYILEDL